MTSDPGTSRSVLQLREEVARLTGALRALEADAQRRDADAAGRPAEPEERTSSGSLEAQVAELVEDRSRWFHEAEHQAERAAAAAEAQRRAEERAERLEADLAACRRDLQLALRRPSQLALQGLRRVAARRRRSAG